jgi:uncharacterized membrane protein (DUF2068 family)
MNLSEPSNLVTSRQVKALRLVALLELMKGLFVLGVGFGVLSLVHRDAWDVAASLLRFLHVSQDRRYAQVFLDLADRVTDAKLWAIAAGAAVYSTLRFIEAYGLWKARAWAEWFALIFGAFYLPFEVYEIARRITLVRGTVLLVNLAIVLYMLHLRIYERTCEQASH